MIQDYVQLPYAIPLGSHYNTGEVIKQAQAVGADLWHMSATSGPFLEFKSPKTGYAYRQLMGNGSTNYVKDTSAIIVGADGTRFVSETVNLKHGHVMFHGLYIRVPISLPAFLVFDEAARVKQPFYRVWSEGMEPYYPVNDEKNSRIYADYRQLAESVPNVLFGGRLAQYTYADMDDTVAAALALCKTEL